MTKVIVVNSPNLGRFGVRQPDVHGRQDFDTLCKLCTEWGKDLGPEVEIRQIDDEVEMVHWMCQAAGEKTPVAMNPTAFMHYSYALADATYMVIDESLPLMEVHISNPSTRDEFRKRSVISPVATGTITGMDFYDYKLALDVVAHLLSEQDQAFQPIPGSSRRCADQLFPILFLQGTRPPFPPSRTYTVRRLRRDHVQRYQMARRQHRRAVPGHRYQWSLPGEQYPKRAARCGCRTVGWAAIAQWAKDPYGTGLGINCGNAEGGPATADGGLIIPANEFAEADRVLDAVSGETSEDAIVLYFDIRHAIGQAHEQIIKRIQAQAKAAGGRIVDILDDDPYCMQADDPRAQLLTATYSDVLGCETRPVVVGDDTHARFIPCVLNFGPEFHADHMLAVDGINLETPPFTAPGADNAHGTDEWVSLKDLKTAFVLYVLDLVRLDQYLQ